MGSERAAGAGLPSIPSGCDFLNTFGMDFPPLLELDLDLAPMDAGMPPPLAPQVHNQDAMLSPLAQKAQQAFQPAGGYTTPPVTPRKVQDDDDVPMTPPPSRSRQLKTPMAPKKSQMPDLMKALFEEAAHGLQCLPLVQAVLENDSQAAWMPFWDHDFEPPLCYAVRMGCDVEVVKLLIRYGCDVKAVNAKGNSALDMLNERSLRYNATDMMGNMTSLFGHIDVEAEKENLERTRQVLLGAGAVTHEPRISTNAEPEFFLSNRASLPFSAHVEAALVQ